MPKANPVHPEAGIALLPEALLAQILQHVPQQQRLTCCALVCKAWAAAAVLATVHVQHRVTAASMPALNSWLQQHAAQLEALDLDSHTEHIELELQLPLHSLKTLQWLQLDNLVLRLLPPAGEAGSDMPLTGAGSGESSSGDGHAAATAAAAAPAPLLPCLEHLQLCEVELPSLSTLLQLVQAAPQLTSLCTNGFGFRQPAFFSLAVHNEPEDTQQVADALPGLLQQLPRLAVLELQGMPLSTAAVKQIAAMQGLQQAYLAHTRDMPVWDLQLLPSSLTRLRLDDERAWLQYGIPCIPSLPPQLQQLTGLLQLSLELCLVPASVLGAFTRLQQLRLQQCQVLPLAAMQSSHGWQPHHEIEGTAALLEAVHNMPHLQQLQLALLGAGAVTHSMAPQQFSALTASSHLTELQLHPPHCTALPRGAVQHMFRASRQLPLLQRLSLDSLELPPDWCIDGTDIVRICECCPGLRHLDMSRAVSPNTDPSALLQLPQSCTSLSVGGATFDDRAAPVLVQLTQLKQLNWLHSEGFTDAGLEQLAQLDLDHLDVHGCSLTTEVCTHGWLILTRHPDKGSVSQQLDALCESSPVCMPARIRRLREAAAASDARQQQLQQEVDSLRAQLESSQAQVRLLQQQLEEARGGGGGGLS